MAANLRALSQSGRCLPRRCKRLTQGRRVTYLCVFFHSIFRPSLNSCSFFRLPGFLNCALQNYFLAGTRLTVTLPLMERVRLALPNVMKIWQNSSLVIMAGETFQTTVDVEEDVRQGLAEGGLTMESDFMPDGLVSLMPHRWPTKVRFRAPPQCSTPRQGPHNMIDSFVAP